MISQRAMTDSKRGVRRLCPPPNDQPKLTRATLSSYYGGAPRRSDTSQVRRFARSLPVASIRAILGAPGKFLSMIQIRPAVNTCG